MESKMRIGAGGSLALLCTTGEGLPSQHALGQLLRGINKQLEENVHSLEHCMEDVLKLGQDLPVPPEVTSPREVADFMVHSGTLDRSRCDSPEPQDTTDLLLRIKEAIDQHPGQEDALFNSLMKISSQQGLCLPLPLVSSSHVTSSTVSLNAIPDEDDQGNVALWSQISVHFRGHFLQRMEDLPVTGNSCKKRLEYLQNSLVFSSARDVWRKYRALRNRQWMEVLKKDDHPDLESSVNVSHSVASLERAQPLIASMMAEDCTLLNCGIFDGTVKAPKAIRDMYLTGLCGWLSGLVEDVTRKKSQEDRKERRKNGRQKDKAKSAMKMSASREAFAEETEEDMASPEDSGTSSLSRGDMELLCRAVSVFLALEAHVESLVSTMWDPSHSKEGRDGQRAPLRGVLKNSHSNSNINQLVTDSDSTDVDSAPRETADSETVNMPNWQWRATLLELVPDVVASLSAMVQTALKAGEEEEEMYTQNRTLPTEELCAVLYGGELDYPRLVSRSCAVLSRCLQQLLPLAVAGSEGGTDQIRTAFVEKTAAACDQVVAMLTKVAADCPHQAPIQNMYICLASAAFLRNQVFHFNSLLVTKGERGPLHPSYQSVRDFVDSLEQQVIGYHTNVIATSVLQDSDSHYWEDPRAFYEGERCSFAVQMWSYHLSALRHDLWVYAPPRLGQHVLACVLRDSLAVLAARYSQASPSYNRTPQFRSDITAVLLITCSYLWSVCDSLHCLLDTTNPPSHPVTSIHNHCTTLMAALTVVSSPLADLYKAFKKGFHHKKKKRGEEGEIMGRQNMQWLHFLYPGLFGQLGSFHDLTTKQAVYVQLKLLCSQPAPDWAMLLHLLMMGGCQAPVLLLTQTGLKETVHTADRHPSPAVVCGKLHCQQDSCTQPGTPERMTVLQSVVEVILCCPQYPTVLSKVLLPVIDRLEGWEFFEVSMFAERLEKMPLWCRCLVDAVQPIIKSVVMCAVDYVTEHLGKPAPPNMAATLSALPCGCRATKGDESDGEEGKAMSTKVVLTRALACLLSALMETVQTIPTAVQLFCKQLQDKLTEKEIQTAHSSVGLQLLAGAVYLALHDQTQLEQWAGHTMKQTIKDNLSLLGLCAYHVLTATVASSKGNMPRLAYTFMRKHGSWLSEQIDNIVESVSNVSVDEGSSAAVLEGGNLEFLQLFMSTLAHKILQEQQGKNNLVHLFHVIKGNQQWFQVQLGIPPLLGKDDLPQVVPFEPSPGSGEKVMTFNPLQEFNSIGDCNIDQNFLLEFPWDWAELLQSDLGLSELGFTTLLQHRCDMTDESCLDTDKEKRHVATLKAKFGLEQTSSV
ncbi:uncharacterized protein KIAA0825 homolog isoform X2 [Branchiostoma floridae x Branchiostoma japonicum]